MDDLLPAEAPAPAPVVDDGEEPDEAPPADRFTDPLDVVVVPGREEPSDGEGAGESLLAAESPVAAGALAGPASLVDPDPDSAPLAAGLAPVRSFLESVL